MATTGHEDEVITVSGLKSSLQKFKTDKVDTLLGPTYDEERECTAFPVTSTATYVESRECVVFS